jgi:DNA-directed RNA polymerase specialized sigma24 family protein
VLPWLLAVANNATANGLRAGQRYQRLLAKLPQADAEPDLADDAAAQSTKSERSGR